MHVFVHVGIIIEGAARARCRRGAAEATKFLITRAAGLWLTGSQRVGVSVILGNSWHYV